MYCKRITTISLVNIQHYTELQIILHVMRTLKIVCLNNFQIYHMILLMPWYILHPM